MAATPRAMAATPAPAWTALVGAAALLLELLLDLAEELEELAELALDLAALELEELALLALDLAELELEEAMLELELEPL